MDERFENFGRVPQVVTPDTAVRARRPRRRPKRGRPAPDGTEPRGPGREAVERLAAYQRVRELRKQIKKLRAKERSALRALNKAVDHWNAKVKQMRKAPYHCSISWEITHSEKPDRQRRRRR